MYSAILVATDGTELAQKAVRQAGELAQLMGARLILVTVTEQVPAINTLSPSVFDDIRTARVAENRAILAAAAGAVAVKAETIHVENREPFEGILDAARQSGADLIVMGSHGRRGFERLLLGSQASKVLSLAQVAVLIVK